MNRQQIETSARLAGQVKRYHAWPVLHPQTVAEHTWHVMRLWWQLFGPMPPAISTYLLWNDAGELVTGDVPFGIKRIDPALKTHLDKVEAEAVAAMGGPPELRRGTLLITDVDRRKAKVVDLLEMAEYGLHERTLGSIFATPVFDDTIAAVRKLMGELPEPDRLRVGAYVRGLVRQWEELTA